jgi:hypothetical protein
MEYSLGKAKHGKHVAKDCGQQSIPKIEAAPRSSTVFGRTQSERPQLYSPGAGDRCRGVRPPGGLRHQPRYSRSGSCVAAKQEAPGLLSGGRARGAVNHRNSQRELRTGVPSEDGPAAGDQTGTAVRGHNLEVTVPRRDRRRLSAYRIGVGLFSATKLAAGSPALIGC